MLVNMVLSAWQQQNKRVQALLDKLSDEQLQGVVAPGRNRGIYLLGHLAAVADMMLPLLDMGQCLRPEMQALFVSAPDDVHKNYPPTTELRQYLKAVNDSLSEKFSTLSDDDWLKKHTSVNEEDFKKDPSRNKLNVVISRTNHLSYHFGQLAFLQPKKVD